MSRGSVVVLLGLAAGFAPAWAGKLQVGEPVPSVELVTLDGRSLDLAGFSGRVVLVKFGFTW